MDDKKPRLLDIDIQKDFGNAVAGDGLWSEKIKVFADSAIFKKDILKSISVHSDDPGYFKKPHVIPPGAPDLLGKVYKLGAVSGRLDDDFKIPAYDGNILIFDEIQKSKASADMLKELYSMLDDFCDSSARGTELAETFQQGTAAPLNIRRPISLRAQGARLS